MDDHRKQPSKAADPFDPRRVDFDALAQNMAQLVQETARVQAAYLKPIEEGRAQTKAPEEIQDLVKTLGHVTEAWLKAPEKMVEAQNKFTGGFIDLWASTLKRMNGEETAPVIAPQPRDTRFKDPTWSENPFFDFLKQAYLHTSQWAEQMVETADGLDPHTRQKAAFYVRQLSGALSPSNFIATNPEILRETLQQAGANLVRGMQMMAEDVAAGGGQLKIRQSEASTFEVGVNLATTPGQVIFRNEVMELIQYAPTTADVLKRPLLIMPPWINKFYILDLTPEKSFIRWCLDQGLTVFCISWVNPDATLRDKGFAEYMREGFFAALDAIEKATGEHDVAALGYCVGGTLLSVSLAYMAAHGDDRVSSASLLTTQVDFAKAGDLRVFVEEEMIRATEARMAEKGYLDGFEMAAAFNMLRPNDLIWPYMINVYMKGEPPIPFDLLYWNADATRMPAANHSFYLRNCYLGNKLARGEMEIEGTRLDLTKVTMPVYNLAAREDHIAPAASVFEGAKAFGGPVSYVMAGSGHIAGVINPAARQKYQFWAGGPVAGAFEDWVAAATEKPGSWWPHWLQWLESQAPERVAARQPGSGQLPALEPAPGSYVKVRS